MISPIRHILEVVEKYEFCAICAHIKIILWFLDSWKQLNCVTLWVRSHETFEKRFYALNMKAKIRFLNVYGTIKKRAPTPRTVRFVNCIRNLADFYVSKTEHFDTSFSNHLIVEYQPYRTHFESSPYHALFWLYNQYKIHLEITDKVFSVFTLQIHF